MKAITWLKTGWLYYLWIIIFMLGLIFILLKNPTSRDSQQNDSFKPANINKINNTSDNSLYKDAMASPSASIKDSYDQMPVYTMPKPVQIPEKPFCPPWPMLQTQEIICLDQ